MGLIAILRVAILALARNKMRSVLTMLGIIIGVAAVICSVAVGTGASNQIQQQIANLGDNMIWVEAGGRSVNGVRTGTQGTKTLLLSDAKAIKDQIPGVVRFSPNVDTQIQVIYGNQNWYTRLAGDSPEYLSIRKLTVEKGSSFYQEDVDHAANVCLLGHTVMDNLFGVEDPLGKVVRVGSLPCQVIGVLKAKGQSPTGQDQDDFVLMPFTTVQKKIKGIDWLNDIWLSAATPAEMKPIETQITALLRERHHLRADAPDDFNLRHPTELAEAGAESQRIMTILLASIASVSLIVGGIGIMNIMLVSVTERTKEIGLRLAVGAGETDVQMQFLGEATVLSVFGGAVGVCVGILASNIISSTLGWPTLVPWGALVVAVIFSAMVGIFFGYYPAHKAAHLDPIDALRYE